MVLLLTNCFSLETGKSVGFPNSKENQGNRDYTRTKKLKQQHKWLPRCPSTTACEPNSAIHSSGFFLSSLLLGMIFFSVTFPCMICFFHFSTLPHHFSNGPSLNRTGFHNALEMTRADGSYRASSQGQ